MDQLRAPGRVALTTVRIDGIAAGGDGVGRIEGGLTVFVPRTAPGDVAEITLVDRKARYARGLLQELEQVSSHRVEPPCRHYRDDRCGGCQLQHLNPDAQLEAKRRMVGDALRRIGRRDVQDPTIVGGGSPWRYRSKVTLATDGERIGLHKLDEPGRVFDLDDCLIVRERIMDLWHGVRAHRDLLPRNLKSLVLTQDRAGGLHVIVVLREAWDAQPLAAALNDEAVSFWWSAPHGVPRVVAGAEPGFPALAFEQSNRDLARQIREAAVEALGEISGAVVWDLYGGVGDTALALAARGARVWTVDADRAAARWAQREGEKTRGIQRLSCKVEHGLDRLPEPRAIVMNPPRTGIHPRVAVGLEQWARLERAPGRLLVYISCDPATLARDLYRLPSFRIHAVTAYDLFPQTSHVETLVVLEIA